MSDAPRATERLRFRPILASDARALHTLFTDADVRRFLFDGLAISTGAVEEILARNDAQFGAARCGLWWLERASDAARVGVAGLWPFHDQLELLYALDPSTWGNGYATEAAVALVRFAFDELGFDEVVASTDAENTASIAVMRRAGLAFARSETIDGLDTVFFVASRSRAAGGEVP